MSVINQLDDNISITEYPQIGENAWKEIQPLKTSLKVLKSNHIPIIVTFFHLYFKPYSFWPEYHDFKNLRFKIKDKSARVSKDFPFENPSHFVLKMKFEDKKDGKTEESENRAQAEIVESYITVLISGGNNDPATLIIRKYQYGDAVAKFVNLCDGMKISILYEAKKDTKETIELNPHTSMFYIWPEYQKSFSNKKEKILTWRVDNSEKKSSYPLVQVSNSGVDECNFTFATIETSHIDDTNLSGSS